MQTSGCVVYATLPESQLRALVRRTVWEPGLVQAYPGVLTAASLADRIVSRFSASGITFDISSSLVVALQKVDLAALQVFWVFTALKGSLVHVQGPDWPQQVLRAETSVAHGVQRGCGASKFALPPLHPRGLSKEGHIAASAKTPSPFQVETPLDSDLHFACCAMATLGPVLLTWRKQQLQHLRKLAAVLQPWEKECVRAMQPCVWKVASTKKPVFLLACALLLRWPDEMNPIRYVLGFPIVGNIEATGLFRPLEANSLLGPAAVLNLEKMQGRVRPGPHDAELRAMTLKEISSGFADGPFSLEQMNEQFHIRGWRPMERFVHVQGCGKLRCMDSGKAPGHNAATIEHETIYTTTVDVVPAICKTFLLQAAAQWDPHQFGLEWCQLILGHKT